MTDRPSHDASQPIANFCQQFLAYDEQFAYDAGASDQEVLDAIRTLDPPSELAAVHGNLVRALETVVAGTATDADRAAAGAAASSIQAYVEQNCAA